MNIAGLASIRSCRKGRIAIAAVVLLAAACRPAFDPKTYATPDTLYAAAVKEFKAKHWESAAKAFEKLTTDLGLRDPRLPIVYFYLAQSQANQGANLLAATTYNRLVDAFPQDTLVDDALYYSGRAYQKLWRKPALDAQYGESAVAAYQSLLAVAPDSPLASRARTELARLDEWFATKDYDTGYLYLKRKAYDSAIIYFKDVIRLHPNAGKTREAYLRLLQAYHAIKYTEDARDLCTAMRTAYPGDKETLRACGPGPVVPATPSQ
jgi:outer membrane assembly lipoprotein YfiO